MTDPKKPTLTHISEDGAPAMVDVSPKARTERQAVAEGALSCSKKAYDLLTGADNPKGDVLQVSRLAGIMAGKRAGELIPLCHILPATSITVEATLDPELPGIRVTATATVEGQTGVEMEALTAVSVALLAAYDMLKSADKTMVIDGVRLLSKSGGRSGNWRR
ncbi:MAG: cyclic pyranopterin monophosphate synthase MoaC [Longimicrobiales bacterium]